MLIIYFQKRDMDFFDIDALGSWLTSEEMTSDS